MGQIMKGLIYNEVLFTICNKAAKGLKERELYDQIFAEGSLEQLLGDNDGRQNNKQVRALRKL